ncbi:MAG: lipopolysaccharide transport periplasmic protein LptA [Burkholderiales bacterium]
MFRRSGRVRPHVRRLARSNRFLSLALAVATCLAPVGARADISDRDKPINLEADRMEIDDAKKVAILTGNVVVSQGTLIIKSDRMVITQDAGGFSKGVAYGNPATFRQKREGFDEYIDGQAQRMEYDGRNEMLELFDKAIVKKGAEEVRGNYISYNSKTEFYQAFGGGKDSEGKEVGGGRVRAVIIPKKNPEPEARPSGSGKNTVPLQPSTGLSSPPGR